MALIGTLRNKMGTWVVVFVFVAIAAFILGDIFSGNSSILNWGRNSVGEIAGKEVSLEEYQAVVREREANYFLNFGREPGEREMISIRQQAWELLIARYALQPQYEEVGVEVTADEVWDMIQGKNIDENVRMAFTNQETGQFDRNQVVSYINQLKSMPDGSEPRIRWEFFQKDLKPARQRIKYENLLLKTTYATKAEAEREFRMQSDVAEVKYVFVPYFSVSDSVANVTDDRLKAYYNENKERFKTPEQRSAKYVSISVVPSAEDSTVVRNELTRVLNGFKTADNDSVYASLNTEGSNPYEKYTIGSLPAYVREEDLVQGNIIGPVTEGDTYLIVKVSRIFNDTTASARAKHILIRWNDESDAAEKEAREKARGILKDIKGGASFEAKAREFGTDGTAQRGGDLGWFSSG
jgi:peptidyl-prolyl cis-trans isomerase D